MSDDIKKLVSEANEVEPSDGAANNEDEQIASEAKRAHARTSRRKERNTWHSRWNALKHGRYAKSTLLPFEDEAAFKLHLREIRAALLPNDYVEQQIVDEYAHALWRLQRQENRIAYVREEILDQLTPAMMANMLGLSQELCAAAPHYLLDLKTKIHKSHEGLASAAYEQYERLMTGAKGISNFNLVWRNFPDLFNSLSAYIQDLGSLRPLFTPGQKDIDLAWQQHPEKIQEHLGALSKQLFYLANFNEFKPQIRIYMESWFFAQRHELKRLERDDAGLIAERKHANSMLDKLMQLRKSQFAAWAAVAKELPMHGFKPPKDIGFRED